MVSASPSAGTITIIGGSTMSIEKRIARLEAERSTSLTSWRLEDGTRVEFSFIQMFVGMVSLMRRSAAAFEGEPLPALDDVCSALLHTSSEERARVGIRHNWVNGFEFELARQENPSEEEIRQYHEEY